MKIQVSTYLALGILFIPATLPAQAPLASGVTVPVSINTFVTCPATPPNSCIYFDSSYYIDVPASATELDLTVTQSTGTQLRVYGRFGSMPDVISGTVVADFGSVPGNPKVFKRADGLSTGRYYFRTAVAIFVSTTVNVAGNFVVTVPGAAPSFFSIGGTVRNQASSPVSGVQLNVTGGINNSTTTGGAGDYSFANLTSGLNYTVTPTKSGCTFTPASRTFNNLSANQSGQDFIASCPPVVYSIGGQVRDGLNAPISGVVINLSGGSANSVVTGTPGSFSFTNLSSGLNYTLVPSKATCTFNPPSITVNNLSADQLAQNFTAICTPTGYSVGIQPNSVTLYPSQTQAFNITITGPGSIGLSTTLSPNLGSLETGQFSGCLRGGSCTYTAPSSIASPQTVTMTSTTLDGTGIGTATINLAPCTYSLSASSLDVASSATPATVNVTAPGPCAWSVSSSDSWLIVTGGPGSGNGSFTVNATVNSGVPRTGVVTLNSQSPRTIAVTQQGSVNGSTGLRFVPLTPCRILETRTAYAGQTWTGAFGPPRIAAGATRTIPVTASPNCSIPSSAKAFVFNVTLDTAQDATGPVDFLTIWPTGEPRPVFRTASTSTGGYIANGAILKAGINGSVDIYSTNNVNLLLDINGYFTDDPTAGLLYYPIAPCRAVDTRGPIYSALPAPFGNQKFARGETRTLRLPSSPNCQIPAAAAYSLQMTLAPGDLTNGDSVAYVTAWPSDRPQPIISNMNSVFGYALANSGIVPASADGSINVFAFDGTNLILDVNGYFAPEDGTNRGLSYHPVTQCRLLNTQDVSYSGAFGPPAISPGVDRSVPIPSSSACPGLPATAKAWALNATVVPNGSPVPFLSLWPDGTPWPGVSQLNAFQGQTVSNSAIVPGSSNGSILVRVSGTTNVSLEVAGYFSR